MNDTRSLDRTHCHMQVLGYLSYSEADFEVFRTAWAARCTDEGEIWHGVDRQISPHRCNDNGIGPPKLEILTKIRNINAPQWRISCSIFADFVPCFRMS